jgi:hypothetical protein
MSVGKYRRFDPHSGHSAMIQVSGMVPTGAGMVSPQPLYRRVKSQSRGWGKFHTGTV